jgi:hypothetical protein
MKAFVIGTMWWLGVACIAQEPDYREVVERWIETGERPSGYTPRMLTTAAVRLVERDELAALGARVGDDPSQQPAARRRATELMLSVLNAQVFAEWQQETQEAVARAVAHAANEPILGDALRGRAIACTAYLVGRDEQRMWLLEGKVQLKAFLHPKLRRLRPSKDILVGLLAYYGHLGRDAKPAFDVLLELYEKDALPEARRDRLLDVLRRVAMVSDEQTCHRLFAALCRRLADRRPRRATAFVQACTSVVTAHPDLLKRPEARRYLPEMIAAVVRRVDEGYESSTDAVLLTWCRDLRAFVDRVEDQKVRAKLLERVRAVVRPMAKSDFDTVRVLASYWL